MADYEGQKTATTTGKLKRSLAFGSVLFNGAVWVELHTLKLIPHVFCMLTQCILIYGISLITLKSEIFK